MFFESSAKHLVEKNTASCPYLHNAVEVNGQPSHHNGDTTGAVLMGVWAGPLVSGNEKQIKKIIK